MPALDQDKKVRLSSIYNDYFDLYLNHPKYPITKEVFKAVNQTIACRTARIGVNIYQCPDCYETKHVLRSCKNRFCPRCGYADTKKWADKMLDKVAPCAHHHIVFTLPASLRGLARMNKRKIHSLLLKSSADTIMSWFEAKHKLLPGIMNVLHTAGSDQKYHPHAHMLCSAGGLNGKDEFQSLKPSPYLVRQGFLAKKFRWYFEKGLFKLYKKGELDTPYMNLIKLKEFIKEVNEQDWVVSVQAPLKKADDIVNYVGRYTKRACINEHNIIKSDNGEITFRYKDYKHSDHRGKPQQSLMTLGFRDFLGRLFEHVPPKGFRSVRYYGMYSNYRLKKVSFPKEENQKVVVLNWREYQLMKTGLDPLACPCCQAEMIFVKEYYDNRTRWVRAKNGGLVKDHWSGN